VKTKKHFVAMQNFAPVLQPITAHLFFTDEEKYTFLL